MVQQSVMGATQQHEVLETGLPAVDPVAGHGAPRHGADARNRGSGSGSGRAASSARSSRAGTIRLRALVVEQVALRVLDVLGQVGVGRRCAGRPPRRRPSRARRGSARRPPPAVRPARFGNDGSAPPRSAARFGAASRRPRGSPGSVRPCPPARRPSAAPCSTTRTSSQSGRASVSAAETSPEASMSVAAVLRNLRGDVLARVIIGRFCGDIQPPQIRRPPAPLPRPSPRRIRPRRILRPPRPQHFPGNRQPAAATQRAPRSRPSRRRRILLQRVDHQRAPLRRHRRGDDQRGAVLVVDSRQDPRAASAGSILITRSDGPRQCRDRHGRWLSRQHRNCQIELPVAKRLSPACFSTNQSHVASGCGHQRAHRLRRSARVAWGRRRRRRRGCCCHSSRSGR